MSFLCAFAALRLRGFALRASAQEPQSATKLPATSEAFHQARLEAAGANAIRLIALRKAFAASTLSVEGQVAAVGTENIGTEP